MICHTEIKDRLLHSLIRKGKIKCAGNAKFKIYGTLTCYSGKRMKRENRVFFKNTIEAKAFGFRPCSKCLPEDYKIFKQSF